MVSPAPNLPSRDFVVPAARGTAGVPQLIQFFTDLCTTVTSNLNGGGRSGSSSSTEALRDEVREALHSYLDCVVLEHGCSKARRGALRASQHTETPSVLPV
jgi:hypothetical protein